MDNLLSLFHGFDLALSGTHLLFCLIGVTVGQFVGVLPGLEPVAGTAMLIPLMAWWFDVSLWQAAVMEAGLLIFFMVYTFAFNWAFDRVFGLPASAQG